MTKINEEKIIKHVNQLVDTPIIACGELEI